MVGYHAAVWLISSDPETETEQWTTCDVVRYQSNFFAQ